MESTTQSNFIYNSSLLSSQELKIDKSNNLKISTFSLRKNESSTISLDLISSDPKVSKHPGLTTLFISAICFITSISLYLSLSNANLLLGQIIAGFLLGLSLIFFAFAWMKPIVTYNFLYKNTSISLFKLRCSSKNNQHVIRFVEQLTQRIDDIERNVLVKVDNHRTNDLESEFTGHLDFLYNHGMVNDVVYDRINDKINEKIYGVKPINKELAEVILLPLRSV